MTKLSSDRFSILEKLVSAFFCCHQGIRSHRSHASKRLLASTMSTTANGLVHTVPAVVRDPRFIAGRAQIGQQPSIDVFSSLLQEAQRYGSTSVEAAPAFYEYGNALFRAAQRRLVQQEEDGQKEASAPAAAREAAAAAAERRANKNAEEDAKPAAVTVNGNAGDPEKISKAKEKPTGDTNTKVDDDDDDDDDDDVQLALEMMETAWSVLDEQSANTDCKYPDWVAEQVPRVLTGIGDVLSAMGRHADSCDTYLRALQHRQAGLETAKEKGGMPLLECRRKVVESNVLIVEELLACPFDQDVVTTESKVVLVKANDVVEYARGYYDKAKDELQETVLLLGQLAASGVEMGDEKENICFVATMVMGAGTALAQLDEEIAAPDDDDVPPVAKKQKK